MTQREIIQNNLNKSDWEITKDKCDSTRANRRHLAAHGKHKNKRKIYCTNVHLRIIEILITLKYNLSAVTAAVTLGSNPIVWLCDQEPVESFQKGAPPEKAKPKRWWTYLCQFRLTVHHIQGIKNELSDYISRNNFDALIGESSEALAKEAFQRMDVQLDLSMRTAGILEG